MLINFDWQHQCDSLNWSDLSSNIVACTKFLKWLWEGIWVIWTRIFYYSECHNSSLMHRQSNAREKPYFGGKPSAGRKHLNSAVCTSTCSKPLFNLIISPLCAASHILAGLSAWRLSTPLASWWVTFPRHEHLPGWVKHCSICSAQHLKMV